MTPQQKLKWAILARYAELEGLDKPVYPLPEVDEEFERVELEGWITDACNEVRSSGVETRLTCDPSYASRSYESKSVAMKMPDGTWVGWTYWYGGGKWGAPESVAWIDDAYDLKCVEEEKMMIVRRFSRMLPSLLKPAIKA